MTLYEFLVPIILAIPAAAGVIWMRQSSRATARAVARRNDHHPRR